MFWGKISGVKNDYYVAMGITYTDKYEFPEKRFFWALSTDYHFQPFPAKNDQHEEKGSYDSFSGMFEGKPNQILVKVEDDIPEPIEGEDPS